MILINLSRVKYSTHQYLTSGGIIDDLPVYDMGSNKYMLVVNASTTEKDLWLNENNDYNVEIKPFDQISLFAVQGPNAKSV